ncbi:hypothetical protein [Streptomyces sp. NPDC048142]
MHGALIAAITLAVGGFIVVAADAGGIEGKAVHASATGDIGWNVIQP